MTDIIISCQVNPRSHKQQSQTGEKVRGKVRSSWACGDGGSENGGREEEEEDGVAADCDDNVDDGDGVDGGGDGDQGDDHDGDHGDGGGGDCYDDGFLPNTIYYHKALEKEMASHSSILAWKIPAPTEQLAGYSSEVAKSWIRLCV